MDPQQTPPAQGSPALPEVPEATKPSFWHRYHWQALGLVATLLISSGLATWLYKTNTQPGDTSLPTGSLTTSTASPPSNVASSNSNSWKSTINPVSIPLGDGKVSKTPEIGYVDSCTTNFGGGGARHAGNWIDESNSTWNSESKVAVEGSVSWPAASYSETTNGTSRVVTTNDLPENYLTGVFPISRADPAYQYDTNPNHIGTQSLSYTLPLNPAASSSPNCLPLGPIGILNDGVVFFNALDAAGRDAVAHETQDVCDGHPNGQEMYHYHNVPSCLRNKATGESTLVGYAFDGYGIYVERDSKGNLPTNADLDACHGRTSSVMWEGKLTTIYHYDATLEYPYTIGCFHGTPVVNRGSQQ